MLRTREEVLDECHADLRKRIVFGDQDMNWIVEACIRQSKIQYRRDRLYDDRLDDFIEPDFL
jgi:hypothetical protein